MIPPPPAATVAWVADALGGATADLDVQPLAGGLTSRMHQVVDRRDGAGYVLRAMVVEPWSSHAEGLLEREAATQRLLAGGPVPAPRCVAVDASGAVAGEPVLLMSRLPGRPLLHRWDDVVRDAVAQLLVTVHATEVFDGDRPRSYQSWAGPPPWPVPPWASRPDVWDRARGLAARPAPLSSGVFLHRDLNPSNLLWEDLDAAAPRLRGVVDWVETSWGPADLDLAHCAKYVALLHGPDAAEGLVEAYLGAGGRLADDPAERAWWTATVVLALRGPERGLALWREQGLVDVAPDLARSRLEEHLGRAVRAVAA